jgi:hypothetical protein
LFARRVVVVKDVLMWIGVVELFIVNIALLVIAILGGSISVKINRLF